MPLQDKIRRFHRRNLSLGYYPGSFRSAMIFVPCFLIISSYTHLLSGGKSNNLFHGGHDPSDSKESSKGIFTQALVGLLLWMMLGMLRKIILRRLLSYRGWMVEGGVPSLRTKLFILSIRLLCGWSKPISSSLYDLQNILPALPVPEIKDTLSQYLESMEPLVDSKKLHELKALAEEFAQKSGPKLQRYLILKSWLAPNYISDWWEDYVYLKSRGSLLIDSNYYAVDALLETTPDQASRAALLTYAVLC